VRRFAKKKEEFSHPRGHDAPRSIVAEERVALSRDD